MGLVVGLCLGIGVALTIEMLDKSIKTQNDVTRYLKLNILGSIPKVKFDTYELQDSEKAKSISSQIVTHDYSPTPVGEAYRALRTNILFSKGSLLVTHNRITQQIVNRLRPSSNADILVPAGTVSILGTTSVRIDSLDDIRPTVQEIDFIIGEGTKMIPALETARYIRAYAGVRPLVRSDSSCNDRDVSRGFVLFDHADDGLDNFVTITGGKLTTYRLMAEKTADLVCRKLSVSAPCRTRIDPLPSAEAAKWTEPGLTPRLWIKHHEPEDVLICECEMVPKSTIDNIIDSIHKQNGQPDLKSISVRSRMGKGPCQGTICGLRLAAYLYERGELNSDQGLISLSEFLRERWRGVRPLLWDMPLIQAELQEALYCGLLCLDLYSNKE